MRVSLNDYVRGETCGTEGEWIVSFSLSSEKRSRVRAVRVLEALERPSIEVSEP